MKSVPATHLLEDLARSYTSNPPELAVNKEYQRGATWKVYQQRALIDSILRGFVLPIFYVHVARTPNLFTDSETVTAWLVDGQQRLNAITEYMRGRFALNDPSLGTTQSAMPYERLSPPRWAGKRFEELEADDRERFLKHPLQVVRMEEEEPNEVRDLFIRLQSGTPLNAQEKRDAWPGNFTLFVIKHAGKEGHPVSNPHAFFDLVKFVSSRANGGDDSIYVDRRSNTRKFFAGLAMTYLIRHESEVDFVDLKASNIDSFYLNKSGITSEDPGVVELLILLDKISQLPEIHRIRDGNKLKFQWAFHFALLVDSLMRNRYVETSWHRKIVDAFERFRDECAKATQAFKQGEHTKHYTEFVQPLSGGGSDTADTIRRRHQFLLQETLRIVQPVPLDAQRIFGPLEREIIWYRQSGKCAHPQCRMATPLSEMHAHHVREHSQGGTTSLDNGVLVCRVCHQNRAEMQALEQTFLSEIVAASEAASAREDNNDINSEPGQQKLRIDINWPSLQKGDAPEVIHRSKDTATIVDFCNRIVEVFGDEGLGWLTEKGCTVTRFPASSTPAETFKNPVTGGIYPYREIGSTGFYVCTQSSQLQKVQKLQTWIANLPEPIGAAISVSVETLSH
jgi:hypothetical protein